MTSYVGVILFLVAMLLSVGVLAFYWGYWSDMGPYAKPTPRWYALAYRTGDAPYDPKLDLGGQLGVQFRVVRGVRVEWHLHLMQIQTFRSPLPGPPQTRIVIREKGDPNRAVAPPTPPEERYEVSNPGAFRRLLGDPAARAALMAIPGLGKLEVKDNEVALHDPTCAATGQIYARRPTFDRQAELHEHIGELMASLALLAMQPDEARPPGVVAT
jgi:hypothetical protein